MTETSSTLLDNVKAISAKIQEQQKELQEASKRAFSEGMKEVFAEYPFLAAIKFAAYTPYFNDGDPCYFSIHEVVFDSIKDVEEGTEQGFYEDGEDFYKKSTEQIYSLYDRDTRTYGENYDFVQEYADCKKIVAELVHAIPSDTHKAMFGDHVSVTIKRSTELAIGDDSEILDTLGVDTIIEDFDHD